MDLFSAAAGMASAMHACGVASGEPFLGWFRSESFRASATGTHVAMLHAACMLDFGSPFPVQVWGG